MDHIEKFTFSSVVQAVKLYCGADDVALSVTVVLEWESGTNSTGTTDTGIGICEVPRTPKNDRASHKRRRRQTAAIFTARHVNGGGVGSPYTIISIHTYIHTFSIENF